MRQLLTESVLLAGLGVVVGLVLAAASFGYLTRLLPANLPASTTLALDWRVLALTIGAALATVLLFGAGPALAAARRDVGAAFGRAVGARGARGRRVRAGLVVAEIALTVVLLAGAGLLLRSYRAVLAVDPGFDAAGLLVLNTVLPSSRYSDGAARMRSTSECSSACAHCRESRAPGTRISRRWSSRAAALSRSWKDARAQSPLKYRAPSPATAA